MLPIGKPIISIEKLINYEHWDKIRRLREREKLSQFELAERLGIAQATLSSVESGETKKINFELIDKVCKEFNVDFEYFARKAELKQVNKDESTGYLAKTQNFYLSEHLIEQYEERIKELKQSLEDLRNKQ